MPKQVRVEGRLVTVPDDATLEEIDEIANPKKEESPFSFRKLISNLPASLIKATTTGPEASPDITSEIKRTGKNPLNPINALSDTWNNIKNTFSHPGQVIEQDPIGGLNTLGLPIQALHGAIVRSPLALADLSRMEMPSKETFGHMFGAVMNPLSAYHRIAALRGLGDALVNPIREARTNRATTSLDSRLRGFDNGIDSNIRPGRDSPIPKSFIDEPQISRPMPGASPSYKQLQDTGRVSSPLLQPTGPTMADLQPVPLKGPVQPMRGPGSPGVPEDQVNGPSSMAFRPVSPKMPTSSGPDMSDMEQFAHENDEQSNHVDMSRIYDEYGERAKTDAIAKAQAKDIGIAKHLAEKGMTEETWNSLSAEEKDKLVNSIPYPEGHARAGKPGLYRGSPAEVGRNQHIGKLLSIKP